MSEEQKGKWSKQYQYFRKSLSVPLAEIINLSLDKGKFPTQLKSANVIPVLKKGDKN